MNPLKPLQCEREMRVIKSVRTGFWDADLQEHVASCPACAEAALAARVLNEMRMADEAEARIPDSGLMWWKAQLLAKREAGEHATRPISLIECFAYVLGAVCVIGACALQWQAIRGWLASLGNGGWTMGSAYLANLAAHGQRVLSSAAATGPSLLTNFGLPIAAGAGLLLLFTGLAVYVAHLEE
jgi:hypothetical protein